MPEKAAPRFTGTTIYKDAALIFEFHYNDGWTRFDMPDHPGGLLLSPQTEDPKTWLSVWKRELDDKVATADADDLRLGLDEGLSQLDEYQVVESNEELYKSWTRFERIYTYKDGNVTRKCKQWVVYINNWMVVITYRAENPEEYDYYLAMVNYSFHTLRWV